MPRAALLSIHARVAGTGPSALDDPSLVQVWGPRYHVYVVAARDLAVFTLGRLPEGGKTRRRAEDLAPRLHALLDGGRMRYDDAGVALGTHGNNLRYAALTGTIAIRWEGARRPIVWTVPPPEIDEASATLELARRFLHIFGPAGPDGFGKWAGIGTRHAARAFDDLRAELVPVVTPSGEAWLLAGDEPTLREPPTPAAAARLLPSGDAYTLGITSEDRALLVPGRSANVASCGLRGCGRVRSSWRGRSSAPGAAPSERSRSRPGSVSRGPRARRCSPRRSRCRWRPPPDGSSFTGRELDCLPA